MKKNEKIERQIKLTPCKEQNLNKPQLATTAATKNYKNSMIIDETVKNKDIFKLNFN
jgi:hypothetical protein